MYWVHSDLSKSSFVNCDDPTCEWSWIGEAVHCDIAVDGNNEGEDESDHGLVEGTKLIEYQSCMSKLHPGWSFAISTICIQFAIDAL